MVVSVRPFWATNDELILNEMMTAVKNQRGKPIIEPSSILVIYVFTMSRI